MQFFMLYYKAVFGYGNIGRLRGHSELAAMIEYQDNFGGIDSGWVLADWHTYHEKRGTNTKIKKIPMAI